MTDLDVTVKRLSAGEDAGSTYCCMAEVPTPWRDSLCLCQDWLAKNLGQFVEGFHVVASSGQVCGHLYYALTPQALVAYHLPPGKYAVIYCEWIQRRFQGQGLGKMLFEHFLAEMRQAQVGGIFVEASDMPGQMYYQDFLPRGFTQVFERASARLLYLPLAVPQAAVAPLEPHLKPSRQSPLEIVVLYGYLCPFEISTHLLLGQVAREFGTQVALREVWLTPETLRQYGMSRGIFINGRQKLFGGETEAAIRQAILEEL